MNKKDWGVHQTHCCFKHGCKYGFDAIQKECPVYTGKIQQEYPCEDCDSDSLIKLFFGCYIEVLDPIIKDIKTQKSIKKWCFNEDCPVDKKHGFDIKFTSCPYCKSDIGFKDIIKSQRYPTETNLNLINDWEVEEIREYPKIKKFYFFKEDLKNLELISFSGSSISGIDCQNVDYHQLKIDDKKSKDFISMFESKHVEVLNLLKQNFSNVNVKFGLISFPVKYYREYDY